MSQVPDDEFQKWLNSEDTNQDEEEKEEENVSKTPVLWYLLVTGVAIFGLGLMIYLMNNRSTIETGDQKPTVLEQVTAAQNQPTAYQYTDAETGEIVRPEDFRDPTVQYVVEHQK